MPRPRSLSSAPAKVESRPYQHPDASSASPPEIGAQPHFKKKLAPTPYRYDSSLSPELSWDTNPSREEGEALLAAIEAATTLEEAQAAARKLARLSRPFLNWTGKAERLSFEVPTLPLFVHERLATSAILETLKSHKRDKQLSLMDDLFGVPERPLIDQVLRPYEHGPWVNRLVLGDSLLVMNSLLRYDGLGGQVQMIYMDPPYGVKFGSNFQPFVRKRDVKHNEDEDFTREPEMVQAYRDTWELGLHSYLTYLRDRLFLARDLLKPEGSIFVQISDENLHHVRELMDEVFGAENFVSLISYSTTSGFLSGELSRAGDYLIWYAKSKEVIKYRQIYVTKASGDEKASKYTYWDDSEGNRHTLSTEEKDNPNLIPADRKLYAIDNLISQGFRSTTSAPFMWQGITYDPGKSQHWKATLPGLEKLGLSDRLVPSGRTLMYKRYIDDFPAYPINNIWADTGSGASQTDPKIYVVQTRAKVVQRCMLMTTDPGDLVFDPTCGSGTTAYVAEQWGRRWVTCDTSRVPLALARQRILTATFPYYELKEAEHGPAGGFVYKRRQNQKGEEVGGIVPHITLKSIANDEPPAEEVLVDRPEVLKGVVRVSGPFTVQATIPAASGIDDDPGSPTEWGESFANHTERMTEVLRRAPVLRLTGNQSVTLRNIRPPAKTLALSAEALLDDAEKGEQAVAIAFGPESGPISLRQTQEAWQEANLKGYSQLLLIGFGIDPKAREFVEQAGQLGIPAIYLQATMDLQMGDLLKNLRSSQVFSVCGLPEIEVHKAEGTGAAWQVKLLGLDTFDPVTMDTAHLRGDEVPAWFLDTDYNGLVFRVRQAFFPRTGAWESLKKALRTEFEDSVWEHLSGTTSAPFEAGDQRQIAVKVIDPRGNELTVVQSLPEAKVE